MTDVVQPATRLKQNAHGFCETIQVSLAWNRSGELPAKGRASQSFTEKISGEMTPSETLVTLPVIKMSKPSRISILMMPPGLWTETFLSTRPSLCATAADALLLLPLASV